MPVRKPVTVAVELVASVKTVEDVWERLEILPDDWDRDSIGVPKVEVTIKVPSNVSEEDVDKHVQGLMAELDAAREVAEDARNRRMDEAKAKETIGKGL